MDWRRTFVEALLIAAVAAAVVWFLEDFEREKVRETFRQEVESWLERLPTTETGGEGNV